MPTAFVTGATGFVGCAVARELIRDGWSVRLLARDKSDPRNLDSLEQGVQEAGGRVQRHPGDLLDVPSLERGLRGCDALYHVAARYSLWNPRPRQIYRDNVEGTRNVLEAARRAGVERLVYTSTVGTLHLPDDGRPGDETRIADLDTVRGHYKRSKWLAENEARRLAREGAPVVIVHPSAPVGTCDIKPTPTGRMIVHFLDGRARAYTDTGLNIVDVEDVARGHLLAAERGEVGESYILGSENMSLLEIFQALSASTGVPAPGVRLPTSALLPVSLVTEIAARFTRRPPLVPWEALSMSSKRMYFDTSRARRDLGYEPGPARRALERAALWFYDNGYTRRAPREDVVERLREGLLTYDAAS